ncbi:MAG: hypothetical protein OXB96_00105 [Candidatus Kaiserbacteria bacterium]|nr:hypothetical protein [Candidatus Kaiserbacteria bacterium]
MDKNLDEVIKIYATKSHKELSGNLLDKSKESVIAILINLLTVYFNDKNSSALREYILVTLSGFTPSERKIGYNGYRQKSLGGTGSKFCEAKPKNKNTNDKGKNLNGSGNFTDYTFARFKRDKKENPLMIVGGFIDGKLIYMFRFPFKSKSFTSALQTKLKKRFPRGKDRSGEYLRSASFTLKEYKDIRDLKLDVFISKKELAKQKKYITRNLFSVLEQSLK